MVNTRKVPCAFVLALALLCAIVAQATDVLFPSPLHLTRRIEDSVAQRAITLEEYCQGDRIVTVDGPLTTIVDYRQKELTEIDHRGATYSITRFDQIAGTGSEANIASSSDAGNWRVAALGTRMSAANRSVETFEIVANVPGRPQKIEVGVDRGVSLARPAAEVLIGAAYPRRRTAEHEALLSVAARQTSARAAATSVQPESYGLIAEQVTTYSTEGLQLIVKNSITAIDTAVVPSDALLIPPGATRVESRLTRMARELHDLDHPSNPVKP